jgi:hypothetical protein
MTTPRTCLLALLAACGEVHSTPADPDAAAPEPDAAVDQRVHVTVLDADGTGLPDPVAKVLFQGPDGALVHDGFVDPDGAIAAVLPAGGSVTAIQVISSSASDRSVRLQTTTGVKPGDRLIFGSRPPAVGAPGMQTRMTAGFTPVAGASTHVFQTACQNDGAEVPPVTITLHDRCHGSTFDVLAMTLGVTPPRYAYVPNVPHVNGGQFSVPGAFQPMDASVLRAINTPAVVNGLQFRRGAVIGSRTMSLFIKDYVGDPPAGTVLFELPFPPGVGARTEFGVMIKRPDAALQILQGLVGFTPSEIDVDLSRLELPFLTDLVVSPTGASWRAVTTGGEPDGMQVMWHGQWNDGQRTTNLVWYLIQPATMTGFQLPRLPPAYRELDPQDQIAVSPRQGFLRVVDYDVIGGYDQLRQTGDALFESTLTHAALAAGEQWTRRLTEASLPVP